MPTPRIVVADTVETENEEIYFSSRLDNSIKRNGKLVSFSLIRADLLAVDGVLGYYITFVSLLKPVRYLSTCILRQLFGRLFNTQLFDKYLPLLA